MNWFKIHVYWDFYKPKPSLTAEEFLYASIKERKIKAHLICATHNQLPLVFWKATRKFTPSDAERLVQRYSDLTDVYSEAVRSRYYKPDSLKKSPIPIPIDQSNSFTAQINAFSKTIPKSSLDQKEKLP